jgi:hypothetical protein
MEVNSWLQTLADLPMGKEPMVLNGYEAAWDPVSLHAMEYGNVMSLTSI